MSIIEKGMRRKYFEVEKTLKGELTEVLKREECFKRQKSRETWLKEGDKNTKYFHRITVENRSKNKIMEINKEDGIITQSLEEINNEAVSLFEEILKKRPRSTEWSGIGSLIPSPT